MNAQAKRILAEIEDAVIATDQRVYAAQTEQLKALKEKTQ